MILLDTVTISEPAKRNPNPHVLAWFRAQDPASLFVSVLSLGEIERGIALIEKRDEVAARRLNAWRIELESVYADRIVDFDLPCATLWGRFVATSGRNDIDVLIGATAARHGWKIATRNVDDFAMMKLEVVDPWSIR